MKAWNYTKCFYDGEKYLACENTIGRAPPDICMQPCRLTGTGHPSCVHEVNKWFVNSGRPCTDNKKLPRCINWAPPRHVTLSELYLDTSDAAYLSKLQPACNRRRLRYLPQAPVSVSRPPVPVTKKWISPSQPRKWPDYWLIHTRVNIRNVYRRIHSTQPRLLCEERVHYDVIFMIWFKKKRITQHFFNSKVQNLLGLKSKIQTNVHSPFCYFTIWFAYFYPCERTE